MDDSTLTKSACGRYEIWLHEELQQSYLLSGPSGIQIVDRSTHEDILTLSNQEWDVSSRGTGDDGFLRLTVFLFGTKRLELTLDLDARRFCIHDDQDAVIATRHSGWNSDWGRLRETLEASARGHEALSSAAPAGAIEAAAVAPSEFSATPSVDREAPKPQVIANNTRQTVHERDAATISRREATSHGDRAAGDRAVGKSPSTLAAVLGALLKWAAVAFIAIFAVNFVIALLSD